MRLFQTITGLILLLVGTGIFVNDILATPFGQHYTSYAFCLKSAYALGLPTAMGFFLWLSPFIVGFMLLATANLGRRRAE